jgi:hypothetical protein
MTSAAAYLFLFVLLIGVIFQSELIRILRKNHHEVWLRLGQPRQFKGPLTRKNISSEFSVFQFIVSRAFRRVQDQKVKRFGNIAWICYALAFILLLFLLILWVRGTVVSNN